MIIEDNNENTSITVELLKDQRAVCSILGMGNGWLVVDKPEDTLTVGHPWFPGEMGLVGGLNTLINNPSNHERFSTLIGDQKKIDVRAVYELDREISGVALFVFEEKLKQNLRNAYGSQQLEITFQFFTRGNLNDRSDRLCELPIAPHFSSPKMVVSNKTGKKTRTLFRYLKKWGPVSLWEARVHYLRWHQVRLHAFEVGLPILGEDLYANEMSIYLSELRKLKKKPDAQEPVCPGLALHLSHVSWNPSLIETPMPNTWTAPLRPKMNVLIKKLTEKYGEEV